MPLSTLLVSYATEGRKTSSCGTASLSPPFCPETREYKATVPHYVSSVEITALPHKVVRCSPATQPTGPSSVGVAGGETLQRGKNTVIVTVQSGGDLPESYTISIRRQLDPVDVKKRKIAGVLASGSIVAAIGGAAGIAPAAVALPLALVALPVAGALSIFVKKG